MGWRAAWAGRRRATSAVALLMAALAAPSQAGATSIGVTLDVGDNGILLQLQAAIAAEGLARGVGLQVQDAEGDVDRQARQVATFIAEKADSVIVEAVDPAQTAAMTRLAVAAKVPLVYVYRKPQDGPLPPGTAFVGANDKAAGQLEAQALVKCLGQRGNVVILQGAASSETATDRTAGAEAVLAGHPGIHVIEKQSADGDRRKAIDLMNGWIAGGVTINGVVAANDDMALGAIFALKQAGLDPRAACIGGIDASPGALPAIADGTLRVSVSQSAGRQGKGAVDTALALIKRRTPNPALLEAPVEAVTRENVDQYLP